MQADVKYTKKIFAYFLLKKDSIKLTQIKIYFCTFKGFKNLFSTPAKCALSYTNQCRLDGLTPTY